MAASNMQLTMNAGIIDTGASNTGTHAGVMTTDQADLKHQAAQILGNFAGGAGSEQHAAVMQKVNQLIDEHIAALNAHKLGLTNAAGTAVQTGQRMVSRMGQTAIGSA